MAANNIASFTFGRIGDSLDIANNAYVENDTKVRSGTVGFKSTIPSGLFKNWAVDGYYQFGETNLDARQIGGIRIDRIFMALDAVKNPDHRPDRMQRHPGIGHVSELRAAQSFRPRQCLTVRDQLGDGLRSGRAGHDHAVLRQRPAGHLQLHRRTRQGSRCGHPAKQR